MRRKLKVNWTPSSRQWVKQYQGKKYYLGTGRCKSDRKSYNRAVAKLNEIKRMVYAGESVASIKVLSKKSTLSTKRNWNPRLVSTVVRNFVKTKREVAESSNEEELSFSRVQSLKNRLQHFRDYFANESLSLISESQLNKWSLANAKRVQDGIIKPSTLHQEYNAVKQIYRWSYKQHIINVLPRNLGDIGKQSKAYRRKMKSVKRHLFFTKEEIQKLYMGCCKENFDSSWLTRTDTEIELLKLAVVLSLNTGMTQKDLNDLLFEEIYVDTNPPRCIRKRSKTGEDSNHILWRESMLLLDKHLEGKTFGDTVLSRKDGRDLIIPTVKNGKRTGGRSDILGAMFKRLVERVLGKDDKRRFRELRRTSAEFCKKRMVGTEKLFLSHADGSMSSFYTTPAQEQFDSVLSQLEVDLGFVKSASIPCHTTINKTLVDETSTKG